MKNFALALLASTALFACSAPAADEAGSDEAAYSFFDPPRPIEIDAATVHVECTTSHGSFTVLTFEDRVFTAKGTEDLTACLARRQQLASQTAPLTGTLLEERGAIRRGTLDLGALVLESWGE